VDGCTRSTLGTWLWAGRALTPCTPTGVVEILRRERFLWRAAAWWLWGAVTWWANRNFFCCSGTRHGHDLPLANAAAAQVCREADILIAALGKPGLITADFVKSGAVVIDVASTRLLEKR